MWCELLACRCTAQVEVLHNAWVDIGLRRLMVGTAWTVVFSESWIRSMSAKLRLSSEASNYFDVAWFGR